MSMPHDTTAASEPKEKWLHDHRKDVFPNKADWTVQAVNGTHIWLETEVSGCFSQDCKVCILIIDDFENLRMQDFNNYPNLYDFSDPYFLK